MKKVGIWMIGAVLTLTSCNTYTGQGAYAGGTIGAILGSAIGGISGEQCTVSFEIMNRTNHPLYDVQPERYVGSAERHFTPRSA